jgi:hypothetical protein
MGETVVPPADERPREPAGSWGALFQHSADPVFLLSRRRQLRFANRAWEAATGRPFEALRGSFCLPRKKKGTGPVRALLQAHAPPAEVLEGRALTVRRPAPPARTGPPWWDVTFIPLRDETGLTGILGFVRVIGAPAAAPSGGGFSEAIITLRQRTAAHFSYDLLASESAAVQRVEAQARLAAGLRAPVWISGEMGTGKETLARVIHFQGVTREQTFLAIDCAGLQPFLVRGMLFGHVGQAGPRLGTVYLKDPASLPRDLQAELLDWVEELDAPPRVVAGSRDLAGDDLRSGRLLPEFHAALNVLEIRLPPLRERLSDLPRLAEEFLRRSVDVGAPPELARDARDALIRHPWPGNLREYGEVLRDAFAASGGKRIELAHLPLPLRTKELPPAEAPVPNLDVVLGQVEARLIRLALRRAMGNKSEAADLLGVPRARLLRRIESLKIEEAP